MFKTLLKNDWLIFTSFLLFAVLLRVGTFIPTVIDPDESTYLVMAHQLINGDTLYVDTVDIKPFGIYIFFAGLISIFQHVFFIRFVAVVLIALSAFCLYKIKSVFTEKKELRWMVGLTYVALMSTPFGFSFNTEILFTTFTILGLYFLVCQSGLIYALMSGLVFGLGFMTKYLVLFDVLAIFIFFFIYWVIVKKKLSIFQYFLIAFVAFLGFLIPFWGAHFYYYFMGHYKEFHFITYELPFYYQGIKDVAADLDFVSGIHQRYIPFIIVFYLSLLNFWSTNKNHLCEKLFVFLWYAATLYAIYLPGAHYRHYYLQAIPAVSFLVPNLFFENKFIHHFFEKIGVRRVAIGFLVCIAVAYSGYWTNHYLNKPDLGKDVANYLADKVSNDEVVFVSNPHIAHVLLDKKSPTRYVHPTLMVDADRVDKFQIDLPFECDYIFDNNPPKYWIRGNYEACDSFGWKENYTLEKELAEGVLVFKRME